jgi:putative ABC transport system permease protein
VLGYNFELALRGLTHHPRTTVLVVLTMALGLASAMTTLTLLHMLSADPLPGISQHLYLGWVDSRQTLNAGEADHTNGTTVPHSMKLADAVALVAAHRAQRQAMLTTVLQNVQTLDNKSQAGQVGLAATSELFPMFGIPLRHGRYWTAQEDADHTPVVVISAQLSQKLFGMDDAVGRSVRIGGQPFRIIGISARWSPQPHFYGLEIWSYGDNAESLFLPVTALLDAGLGPFTSGDCDRTATLSFGKVDVQHCRWLSLWTQLDTAAQVTDYRQFLLDYARDQKAAGRFERTPTARLFGMPAWLAANYVVPENVRLNVLLAGGFLLLCMVNVAGLLAARFLRRSTEIGVRRALGAPRRAIFAQCVWEAGMAGVLGGALALPLTLFGLWVVRRQKLGYTDLAHLDSSMFASMFVLALAVGLLVGLLPAWRACIVQPAVQVKSA